MNESISNLDLCEEAGIYLGTKVCAFKGTHKKFRGEVKSNPLRGKVLVANPRSEKWILLSDLKVDQSELPSPQTLILGEKPRVIDVDKELPVHREWQPDKCVLMAVMGQGILVSRSEPEPENSLGFKEGVRIRLIRRPNITGTISHYHKPTGGWWVNWDSGNNYAVPGKSLELDPEEYVGFRVGQEVIERKGQPSQRPGKIVRFEKVGDETRILIDVGGFEVYSHPDILSPLVEGEQLGFDLVEEESAIPFELLKGKRVYCDVSEKRGEILGWRTMRPLPTEEPTKYVSVRFDDGSITVVPHSELEEIEQEEFLPIEQKYGSVESWPEGKDVWSLSEFVDSLKEWAGFPLQHNESVDLTGDAVSKLTPLLVESCETTLTTTLESKTSKTFTQDQANTTLSLVDSPALAHQQQVRERVSITQNQLCFENSSDVLEKPDPSLFFWSNLQDLSIEDLERGWEDCAWVDTKASIQSLRALINSERNLRGSGYLSFPTLLSGRGRKHRDVGNTHCETWWKNNVIKHDGYQLSSEAIACLHGFPTDWFRVLSPSHPDIQEESQPESLEVKPLPSLKLLLPSNGSNGSGEKSKRKRSLNKKPASGSLSRCVSVKKGKEYSTFQYNYDIRDPGSKRGWRTVKEGVPRHLSGAIADAISQGKPIREILSILGREPRGEINE